MTPAPTFSWLLLLSLAACRVDPEKEGTYTPDPPVDGKLLLNLSLAHLDDGPAYGARDIRFTLNSIDVVVETDASVPPVVRHVASGPVPFAIYTPEVEASRFAGEFWVPPGKVVDVRVEVSDVSIVDAQGDPDPVKFGPQGNQTTGTLRFRTPPGQPAVFIQSAVSSAFEAMVPLGLN